MDVNEHLSYLKSFDHVFKDAENLGWIGKYPVRYSGDEDHYISLDLDQYHSVVACFDSYRNATDLMLLRHDVRVNLEKEATCIIRVKRVSGWKKFETSVGSLDDFPFGHIKIDTLAPNIDPLIVLPDVGQLHRDKTYEDFLICKDSFGNAYAFKETKTTDEDLFLWDVPANELTTWFVTPADENKLPGVELDDIFAGSGSIYTVTMHNLTLATKCRRYSFGSWADDGSEQLAEEIAARRRYWVRRLARNMGLCGVVFALSGFLLMASSFEFYAILLIILGVSALCTSVLFTLSLKIFLLSTPVTETIDTGTRLQ